MTIHGMDIEEAERLADQLKFQADAINTIVGIVDTTINLLTQVWFGADLQRFHSTWQSTQRAQAHSAEVDIEHALTTLRREIAQQRTASRGSSSTRGVGVGVGAPTTSTSSFCREPKPSEFLELAGSAYGPPGPVVVNGHTWTPLSAAELDELGVTSDMLKDESCGFSATIYRDEDGTLVVAYAGTDPKTGADLLTDAQGAAPSSLSDQTERAVQLALRVDNASEGPVIFTGHSLGGRLAAVSSITTDRSAVTFNAAGVSDSEFYYALIAGQKDGHEFQNKLKATFAIPIAGANLFEPQFRGLTDLYSAERRELKDRVTAYYGTNDPLTVSQEVFGFPNAVGKQIPVDSGWAMFNEAHSIDGLRDGIDKL